MSKLGNVPHRYARYAEIMFYEGASSWQTFKYGKLGEVTENIRTFALPFENQTYTFKMNFEYDPFNRIQSMLYPDSELVEYRYNLGGMLNKVTGSVTRKITDLIVVAPMQNTSLLQGGNEIQGGDIAPGIIPDPGPIEIQTVTLRYPYLDCIVYNKFELKDSVVYGNGTAVLSNSLERTSTGRALFPIFTQSSLKLGFVKI